MHSDICSHIKLAYILEMRSHTPKMCLLIIELIIIYLINLACVLKDGVEIVLRYFFCSCNMNGEKIITLVICQYF